MSQHNQTKTQRFEWKGKLIGSYGEIGDALCALETEEEGVDFFNRYLAVNVHAAENIGYLMGYYDRETAERVWRLTGTAHPIFGRNYPTPETALDAGKRMGEENKRHG